MVTATFTTAGLCDYRDGRDSVAWHGDTIGRSRTDDTMVAIVSFGEDRRLLLRPREGGAGATLGFSLGHGDLLVMGGSCQRTWEHAVPKTAKPVGPRVSVKFRPHNVRSRRPAASGRTTGPGRSRGPSVWFRWS